ncbi:MAG: hypothetical protein KDA84_19690, partial [Planctomycetaceae bacterium]|nr:hypothetical protein [Planctomycetaceae bacterium]
MKSLHKHLAVWSAAALMGSSLGCSRSNLMMGMGDFHPKPLGTLVDPAFQDQEMNAEASDFVIYQHEWNGESTSINDRGLEHLKRIYERAPHVPFPILIEPTNMAVDQNTEHKYPVNGNHALDMQRRQVIVAALTGMGMAEAEQRVVVANALTPGFQGFEAQRAYNRGFSNRTNGGFGGGGFGGGGGGFGGGGFGAGF